MFKHEIEKSLEGKGNFIKIDYLTRILKEDIPMDVKKFISLKLAEIYEKMNMFNDSAKIFNSISLLSITFSEKINSHIKESKLYIKAGVFDKTDQAMKKAMNNANATQKQEIYREIKDFYKKVAENYEKELKRNKASQVYEKLLEMKIFDSERQEIKKKLLELYEKLGKREAYNLLKD